MKMVKDKIENPIFLIGMGRSGSSIIYDIFSQHEDLAFFSQYCTKFVHFPQLTFVHRFFHSYRNKPQWQKASIFEKIIPNPKEAYDNWEYLCGKKFRNTFLKNITANEIEKEKTIKYIATLIKWQGKKRFVTKLTGPPRITYINSIFNDALFIDIVRDPRATVYSLLNVPFRIKKGLDKLAWENSLNNKDLKEWLSFNKSPVALISLEWRSVFNQTKKEIKKINSKNYMRIKYEDFIKKPQETLERMSYFSNLTYTKRVDDYIKNTPLLNTNYKYKNNLSIKEISIIEQICNNEIIELGYKF